MTLIPSSRPSWPSHTVHGFPPPVVARTPTPVVRSWDVTRWSTPRRLQGFLVLIWVVTLATCIATIATYNQLSRAVKTIGQDAVPSILAAQTIRLDLATMNASAAGDLLGGANGVPAERTVYEARRQDVNTQIIAAAENITYGDEERTPIRTLTEQFGVYQQLVAQSQLLHQQDPTSSQAITTFRQASSLLHGTLLPAADTVDAVNSKHLDDAYREYQHNVARQEILVFSAGGALLLALVATQIFLARKMRRLVNPALLGATVILIILLLAIGRTFAAETYDLKVAKPDAFDSLGVLARMRAAAADARGNEVLSLLDRGGATDYDNAYADNTKKIIDQPITNELITATDRAVGDVTDTSQGVVSAMHGAVAFHGYLADELNNITFMGEKQAAMSILRSEGQYQAVDSQLRALAAGNQGAAAVALCLGPMANQAGGAYENVDMAIAHTFAINKQAFDTAITQGFQDLGPRNLLAVVAAFFIAGLAWLGVQPRINEYAI